MANSIFGPLRERIAARLQAARHGVGKSAAPAPPPVPAKSLPANFAAGDGVDSRWQPSLAPSSVFNPTSPSAFDMLAPREPAPTATQLGGPALAAPSPALKLIVCGFSNGERSLLAGVVKLSQRRTPRLELLDGQSVAQADVLMVDARDALALQWAQHEPELRGKAVLWVDGGPNLRGHTQLRRPVQWSILPMLLARALEQGPTPDAPAATVPMPLDVHAASAAARQVLVVDDSLAVRTYLRTLLEARGLQVSEADSVDGAHGALAQSAYACVFMDVLMPGTDGYEGCKQIKARRRGAAAMPVVMLTSKASPFDRIRGKLAGCDAYITKPVDPLQLDLALARLLPLRPGSASHFQHQYFPIQV